MKPDADSAMSYLDSKLIPRRLARASSNLIGRFQVNTQTGSVARFHAGFAGSVGPTRSSLAQAWYRRFSCILHVRNC